MKKLFGFLTLMLVLGASQLMAQQPSCTNNNGLNNKISSIVNQGFTEIDREFVFVNYIVAPTPPYLIGTLRVTFVGPYCGPACTPIMRTEYFDARVVNANGNCVWSLGGN